MRVLYSLTLLGLFASSSLLTPTEARVRGGLMDLVDGIFPFLYGDSPIVNTESWFTPDRKNFEFRANVAGVALENLKAEIVADPRRPTLCVAVKPEDRPPKPGEEEEEDKVDEDSTEEDEEETEEESVVPPPPAPARDPARGRSARHPPPPPPHPPHHGPGALPPGRSPPRSRRPPRKPRQVKRCFALPDVVEVEKATATLKDGVLAVSFPVMKKTKIEPKPLDISKE